MSFALSRVTCLASDNLSVCLIAIRSLKTLIEVECFMMLGPGLLVLDLL